MCSAVGRDSTIGQRGAGGVELLGVQGREKHIDGRKLQLNPQNPKLPQGTIRFQRNKPCPGFAVLGIRIISPAWAASMAPFTALSLSPLLHPGVIGVVTIEAQWWH